MRGLVSIPIIENLLDLSCIASVTRQRVIAHSQLTKLPQTF